MDQDPVLMSSVRRSAEMTGLSRSRLYELMAAGEIRSVKVGRSRLIPQSELIRFIERLQEEQHGGAST